MVVKISYDLHPIARREDLQYVASRDAWFRMSALQLSGIKCSCFQAQTMPPTYDSDYTID